MKPEDTLRGTAPGHENFRLLLARPKAYVAVIRDGEYRLGIAVQNHVGYFLTDYPPTGSYEAAQKWARDLNERLGLSEREAAQIVLSTLRDNA